MGNRLDFETLRFKGMNNSGMLTILVNLPLT